VIFLYVYHPISFYLEIHGIVLWGCASKSNIAIMKRYQSKILRLITNAPRYVNNQTLHTDIQIPFVHTFFQDHIRKYRNTLEKHPSPLVEPLLFRAQQEVKTKMDHLRDRLRQRRWSFAKITDPTASTLVYRKPLCNASDC